MPLHVIHGILTGMSQKNWVRTLLLEDGTVSRNDALARHITRLAAIVNKLNREGMDITGERVENDYIYTKRRV